MARPDECAEKTGPVEIVRKAPDAASAAESVPSMPVVGRQGIEMRQDMKSEGRYICGMVRCTEKPIEGLIVGQVTGSGEFEPI